MLTCVNNTTGGDIRDLNNSTPRYVFSSGTREVDDEASSARVDQPNCLPVVRRHQYPVIAKTPFVRAHVATL